MILFQVCTGAHSFIEDVRLQAAPFYRFIYLELLTRTVKCAGLPAYWCQSGPSTACSSARRRAQVQGNWSSVSATLPHKNAIASPHCARDKNHTGLSPSLASNSRLSFAISLCLLQASPTIMLDTLLMLLWITSFLFTHKTLSILLCHWEGLPEELITLLSTPTVSAYMSIVHVIVILQVALC